MRTAPDRPVHDVVMVDGLPSMPSSLKAPAIAEHRLLRLTGTLESPRLAGEFGLDSSPPMTNGQPLTLVEALGWTGEWIGLFASEASSSYVIAADYFGFGQVHYSVVPSRRYLGKVAIYVGATFRGVAHALREDGHALSLRWELALPHLTSHTNLFRTRSSAHTLANEICVLPSDHLLVMSRDGFGTQRRPELVLGAKSYEELLDLGIEAAIGDASAALKLNRPALISLSGGKDSRVLFSMLVAGGIEKEFSVLTRRPGNEIGDSADIFRRDLQYASRIVDKFGLNWHVSTQGVMLGATFEEVLDDWQDFRGNQSFEFSVRQAFKRDANEIALSGIGGELFRSYVGSGYRQAYPAWWSAAGGTHDSARADISELFERVALRWLLPKGLYERAREHFVESFTFDLEGSALDHLDASYGQYRSRAHSGVMGWSRHQGTYLAYPLARPEFLLASKMLPESERAEGRLLFDIIERTCPDLNGLPYASPPWPTHFSTKGSASAWHSVSAESAAARYEAAQAGAQVVAYQANGVEPFRFEERALTRVIGSFDRFSEHLEAQDLLPIIQRAARRVQKGSTALGCLLAVTESMCDVLDPRFVPLRSLLVNMSNNEIRLGQIIQSAAARVEELPERSTHVRPVSFEQVLESIDLSFVTAELRVMADGPRPTATVSIHDMPDGCEAAVYILDAGRRLDRSLYTSEKTVVFENLGDEVNVDRATVFLRWQGDRDAQRVFDVRASRG